MSITAKTGQVVLTTGLYKCTLCNHPKTLEQWKRAPVCDGEQHDVKQRITPVVQGATTWELQP